MEILTSRKDPEAALRRMNEAGVLGHFMPDCGRIVGADAVRHVPRLHRRRAHHRRDRHAYQIETRRAEDELPLATALIDHLQSRRALYLAMLLHDIAKGRGGDHSILAPSWR